MVRAAGITMKPRCETICAYIEALFDWGGFYAEVDDDYKINYHRFCNGVYNSTAYDSYDDAIAGRDASLFASIREDFWGCNGSGFEWALKQTGAYDWYFDTAYPFFPNYLIDFYNKSTTIQSEKDAIDGVRNAIAGTWRRTWKYSIGKPQEADTMSGSQSPPSGCPKHLPYYPGTDSEWETYAKDYFTTSTPTAGNTTGRHEPDYEFGDGTQVTAREWEIDNLVDFINEIWDVLNVEIGFPVDAVNVEYKVIPGSYGMFPYWGISIEQANQGIVTYFYKEVVEAMHSDSDWSSSADVLVGGYDFFKVFEDDYAPLNVENPGVIWSKCSWAFKITIRDEDYANAVPYTSIRVGLSYWGDDISGISGLTLVRLSGNINLSLSATPTSPTVHNPAYATLIFPLADSDYRGAFTSTPLQVYKSSNIYAKQYEGDDLVCTLYSWVGDIKIEFNEYDVLVVYDWSKVLYSVWVRDGNCPHMVESFTLPVIPPKPNPPVWIYPLFLSYDLTLVGYIGKTDTAPALRVVEYKWRLNTFYTLPSYYTTARVPDDWEYAFYPGYNINDEVVHNGIVWKCDYDYALDEPSDASSEWINNGLLLSWGAVFDDTEISQSAQYLDIDSETANVFCAITLQNGAQVVLQNYVWYYNLHAWQCYAKSYEDDIETGNGYDTDPDTGEPYYCKWGVAECDFSSGLKNGIASVEEWASGSTGIIGNYYHDTTNIYKCITTTSDDPQDPHADWELIEAVDSNNTYDSNVYVGDWQGTWSVLADAHSFTGDFDSQDTVLTTKEVEGTTYIRAVTLLSSNNSEEFEFYSAWIT
jgi:hypothetical protein